MRVPKPEHYKGTNEKIMRVTLDAPVSISRLPVITNDRQRDKLIKSIEQYIRGSLEYKDFIKFLKNNKKILKIQFLFNPKFLNIHLIFH